MLGPSPPVAPEPLLNRLSQKEREVLDRVIQHKPTKQIARELGIAPNTVDMRLKSARAKLATRDRNETARLYQDLLSGCGKTTCGPTVMVAQSQASVSSTAEGRERGMFVLEDSASFVLPAPWEHPRARPFSEALDDRFGRMWRVIAIPVMALSLALLALALLAIASTLGTLV